MRLEFPNGEHEGFRLSTGELRIGSAPDNEIVLSSPGVAPHHAILTVDARGPILWLLSDEAVAFVNARPVRERAMLRLGDRIIIGRTALLLKSENEDSLAWDIPFQLDPVGIESQKNGPPRVVLRSVSGRTSGQVKPVLGELVAGSDPDCGLVLDDPQAPGKAFSLTTDGRHVLLEALAGDVRIEVNGVPVRRAFVVNGDQIVIGFQRFVVEAPGIVSRPIPPEITRKTEVPEVAVAAAASAEGSESSPRPWLMLTIALLFVLALIFLLFVP